MKFKNLSILTIFALSLILAIQTSAQEVTDTQMGEIAAQQVDNVFASQLPMRARSLVQVNPLVSATNPNLPRKDVVDIASYQSWMTQNDFNQLKAQGVKTVVVKLTEATSYFNPYAQNQINMVKAAGLNVAVYHFAYIGNWDINTNTAKVNATAEANYFVSKANSLSLPKNTVMIFDAEASYQANQGPKFNWTEAAKSFTEKVNASGFANVRYYTPASWAKDGSYMEPSLLGGKKKFWIPEYPTNPDKNNLKYTDYGAWQFSNNILFTSQGVDTSIEYQANFFYQPPVNPPQTQAIYRLYNKNTGEHFYTSSSYERDSLINAGWNNEDIGWTAPNSGTPIYRIYNPN
ncbi:MAG: family 25 glycosyl hydrolase, partial [Streptococcaceae bacterium]|nr:family 25 glycosyl hydrolase [Streptococcaceae bacterium]